MESVEKWMRNDCHWASTWCASGRNFDNVKHLNQSSSQSSVIVKSEERKLLSAREKGMSRAKFDLVGTHASNVERKQVSSDDV
jgi:hypothetical protein